MPYRYAEQLSTSDAGFFAWGKDIAELCKSAVDGVVGLMVENIDSIRPAETRDLQLETVDAEDLIHKCLEEVLYYKDAEGLILRLWDAEVFDNGEHGVYFQGKAKGEAIDPEKHEIGVDVKAITFHNFSLQQRAEQWELSLVVDI